AVPAGELAQGDVPGLADATATLLTKGTQRQSAEAIIEWLDTHGARLTAGSRPDFAEVRGASLSRDFTALLQRMAEAGAQPAFTDIELQRLLPKMESWLRGAYDSPSDLEGLHSDYLLYGYRHPFGRPQTVDGLHKLTRDAIVAFHRAHYSPQGSVLLITGD